MESEKITKTREGTFTQHASAARLRNNVINAKAVVVGLPRVQVFRKYLDDMVARLADFCQTALDYPTEITVQGQFPTDCFDVSGSPCVHSKTLS